MPRRLKSPASPEVRKGPRNLAGEGGNHWTGGFGRQCSARRYAMFVGQKLKSLQAKERAEYLVDLASMIDACQVAPVVGKTFPLREAADAIRYMEQGHALGKVVITV